MENDPSHDFRVNLGIDGDAAQAAVLALQAQRLVYRLTVGDERFHRLPEGRLILGVDRALQGRALAHEGVIFFVGIPAEGGIGIIEEDRVDRVVRQKFIDAEAAGLGLAQIVHLMSEAARQAVWLVLGNLQDIGDALPQYRGLIGLGSELSGAELQGAQLRFLIIGRGNHQDRHIQQPGRQAYARQGLEAIHVRHPDIEQH